MAAGSALGRGAMAAGSALGRGATNIGKNVLQGIAQNAAKQVVAQQQKSQQPKVGGVYNHPKLGALKILAISANGITLDSTKQLGFPITIDPSYIQQ
jgi:hypothetical protein